MRCGVQTGTIALLAAALLVSIALGGFVSRPPAGVPSDSPVEGIRIAAPNLTAVPVSPPNGATIGTQTPLIQVNYTRLNASRPIVEVGFELDDMNLTSAGTFNQSAFVLPLALMLRNGLHVANFTVTNDFSEKAFANWTFIVDTVPPILVVTAPAYPAVPVSLILVQGTASVVSPLFAGATPIQVNVTVLPSHVSRVTSTTSTAPAFSIPVVLTQGLNTLFVNATDRLGNAASVVKTVVSDTVKPPLVVLTPANQSVSPTDIVRVSGFTELGASLTVNGFIVAVAPNGTWSTSLALPEGVNLLQIAAVDQVGNLNFTVRVVFVDADVPRVTLISPLLPLTNHNTVTVAGYVNDTKVVAVLVNGVRVSFDATTGFFSTELTLPDGNDPIVVVAVDAAQHTGVAKSLVVVDTRPPVVMVTSPPDGLETNVSTVVLTGTVDDANATVLVNDQAIRPDAGGRWRTTASVVQGGNTILISAVDAAGNRAAPVPVHVTYFSPLPELENRTAANERNLDALGGMARLSLVGILLLALGIEFVLHARLDRRVRANRRVLAAVVRTMKKKPRT